MRVSKRSASALIPQSYEETISKRQRTKSPGRSLPASHRSPVDFSSSSRQADGVLFVSSEVVDQRDDLFASVPSPFEAVADMGASRKELVSLLRVKGSGGRRKSVADCSGVLSDYSFSASSSSSSLFTSSDCRRSHRVSFAPEIVTSLVEIPSHRSLTAEEKSCLYIDKGTLRAGMKKGLVELQYDRSRHCCANAVEETMFFRNYLGELVHPAHFRSYLYDTLTSIPRTTPVVGFSREEYVTYLRRYALFCKAAVRAGVFQPSEQSLAY